MNGLKSVNTNFGEVIQARTVSTQEDFISSVNVNQLTGDFVTSKPFSNDGCIIIYPQSPNNPTSSLIGAVKTLTNFRGYGFLKSPIDSQFDYTRNKLWISDAGNERVLKIDCNSYAVDFSIANIILPHSVVPNINNGGVFIKAFTTLTNGVIYYYSTNGILQFYFNYLDTFSGSSLIPSLSSDGMSMNTPLPSTMCFDHRRNRLWWTANEYSYMFDLSNNQIISYNLNDNLYTETRGIDIDLDSGNAFITVYGDRNRWFTIQMFRDNNAILSRSYLPENI